MGRLGDVLRGLRLVGSLDADDRDALRRLVATDREEFAPALRAPGIDPSARLSPLASFRFVDRVEVGPRATIGPWCCVWGGWSVTWARVGAGALLSPGVVMVAGNHRIHGPGWVRDLGFDEADVEVGEGAWVGAHTVVVGCRVGAGAVVGANSVVVEDVPDRAIAAGVPARVVGSRDAVTGTD